MSVHEHSVDAYRWLVDNGHFGKRKGEIILYLITITIEGVTDRQVMKALGYTDPNKVRPGITELIKSGVVEECGEVYDAETLKTVRLVRLKRAGVEKKPQPQMGLFP